MQDYEDYYEDEGEEYEEEGGEEYEEEKEAPKPTKGELEYLEFRQKLKESIRKQMKKESTSSSSTSRSNLTDRRKTKLPNDKWVLQPFFVEILS